MGFTEYNFELYLLKGRPLRVPEKALSASCYYNLAMKNAKSTSSTIQISYISIILNVVEWI